MLKRIRGDIILILVLITASVLLFVLKDNGKDGKLLKVSVNGSEICTLSLDEDTEYEIQGFISKNILIIENGKARMKEAGCPDKLCVKQGEISKAGESIICLPNRIILSVEGGEESGIDATAK
ncbi:MAG: NusG domain II-containing protein [Lachnospiraceae bacterium]|nr:NusG domain II-containing protein [Lachnospiraceae bacterium]